MIYDATIEIDVTTYIVEFIGKFIIISYMLLIVFRAIIYGDEIYERY